MNKLYIYVLFIIFGLCIYLYINKKDTFNIGGQSLSDIICTDSDSNIMNQAYVWINNLVYKETTIPCYNTDCNTLHNYQDTYRKKYIEKNIMLIENDIFEVINPLIHSYDMTIKNNINDFKNIIYDRTFNFKDLGDSEIDIYIKNILKYFDAKDIIKLILNDIDVYNNIFTNNCLDSSRIYLHVEDRTTYISSDSRFTDQRFSDIFSQKCNNYLKFMNFKMDNNTYNYWHQDESYKDLVEPESYRYYFNCLIAPPNLRGPLDKYFHQNDCLYMDTQVTTNLSDSITNINADTVHTPHRTIQELISHGNIARDTGNIDDYGYETSNYEATKIITESSRVLRENYITGIMFNNLDKFHSRGTFDNTNGIILNEKNKESYINLHKDESRDTDAWLATMISNDPIDISEFKNDFKRHCASDFLTLPTFDSYCRRIIRITLIFKTGE